jgi:hypothetical protein
MGSPPAGYGVLVLLGFEIGRAACLVMLAFRFN